MRPRVQSPASPLVLPVDPEIFPLSWPVSLSFPPTSTERFANFCCNSCKRKEPSAPLPVVPVNCDGTAALTSHTYGYRRLLLLLEKQEFLFHQQQVFLTLGCALACSPCRVWDWVAPASSSAPRGGSLPAPPPTAKSERRFTKGEKDEVKGRVSSSWRFSSETTTISCSKLNRGHG